MITHSLFRNKNTFRWVGKRYFWLILMSLLKFLLYNFFLTIYIILGFYLYQQSGQIFKIIFMMVSVLWISNWIKNVLHLIIYGWKFIKRWSIKHYICGPSIKGRKCFHWSKLFIEYQKCHGFFWKAKCQYAEFIPFDPITNSRNLS